MAETKLTDTVREGAAVLSERGVMSGLFLGIVIFLVATRLQIYADILSTEWRAGLAASLGLMIAWITYELMMPLVSLLTKPFVRVGFHSFHGTNPDYRAVMLKRDVILNSGEPRVTAIEIRKNQSMRQTLTYLLSASTAAFVMLLMETTYTHSPFVWHPETLLVLYVFVATLLGEIYRSYCIGKAIAVGLRLNIPVKEERESA